MNLQKHFLVGQKLEDIFQKVFGDYFYHGPKIVAKLCNEAKHQCKYY